MVCCIEQMAAERLLTSRKTHLNLAQETRRDGTRLAGEKKGFSHARDTRRKAWTVMDFIPISR